MDYTQLVAAKTVEGSIRNWINWTPAPAETILLEAEAVIYSRLRTHEMLRYKQDGEILENESTVTLPDDHIATKRWQRIGENAGKITILGDEMFMQRRQRGDDGVLIEGTPMLAMIVGGSDASNPKIAHLDVKADQDYDWEMVYWGRPTPLSGSNTSNFLTSRYPWLLRTACMYQGYLHKKDLQMAAPFKTDMDAWFTQANVERDMEAQAERTELWAIGDGNG